MISASARSMLCVFGYNNFLGQFCLELLLLLPSLRICSDACLFFDILTLACIMTLFLDSVFVLFFRCFFVPGLFSCKDHSYSDAVF